MPARILYRLPDRISFEQAAMVEAVSVAVHAVGRRHVEPNACVAVVGTGMIGLLVVQVVKPAGCARIIAIDVDEERLEWALRLGATDTVAAGSPDVAGRVRELTGGRGADLVFEVVGLAATVASAVQCVRKGGSVILVGNLDPVVQLPLQSVVTRQVSLVGTCASAGEYPASLELIASGKVNVTDFISAAPPLADGAAWFERLHTREPGLLKVILVP